MWFYIFISVEWGANENTFKPSPFGLKLFFVYKVELNYKVQMKLNKKCYKINWQIDSYLALRRSSQGL